MAGESEAPSTDAAVNDASLLSDDAGAPDKAAPGAESAAPQATGDTPAPESKPEASGKEDAQEFKPSTESEDKGLLADDEDKSPDKADAPSDAKQDGESEAYQPFNLPEGMTLDEAMVAQATPILKRLNVSQEDAQELVSIVADRMKQAVDGSLAQQRDGFVNLQKEWKAAALADAELGNGDAKALQTKLGGAKDVLKQFGSSEFRSQVNEWGWANSPEFIRFLHRIRSSLSDDVFVPNDAAAQVRAAPKRTADIMYDGDN